MADVGLRDLGAFVPGRTKEPQAPPLKATPQAQSSNKVAPSPMDPPTVAASSTVIVTPPPPKPPGLFGGDLTAGVDALGLDPTLAHLAELAAHQRTAVPLCIGLLGGAGSGKSFALARLTARLRDLAAAASGASPFVSRLHVQAIDAASLDGDVGLALAARLHAGLRPAYPDLAREIAQTARDPHIVLRELTDKLDESRHRLDSERRALDDAGSRRARLTETVLYEAAGSQVDAYARANRAGIESRLAGFGIAGDPIRHYKDLVQLVAGSGGKVGLALRSPWAFKGQFKLILGAIVLVAISIGLGIAIDDQATWLGDLKAGPQSGASVATWFQAHMGLLATAKSAALVLALLCIAANLFRAFGFLKPIFKGARLLDHDIDTRKRDLDSLYAHQTKRVDALDADVERLTREVAEAERRAGGAGAANEPSPFETAGAARAETFFAMLERTMRDPQGAKVPQRIVVALDHLDAVTPDRGRTILDTLRRAGGAFVTLVALDPAPLGASRADLERWIQVPVRLDAGPDSADVSALVRAALGKAPAKGTAAKLDASRSALDEAIGDDEASALVDLAPLAGTTPRAVKRFASLYALARLDGDSPRGALAFMLALAQGGTTTEKKLVADAVSGDAAAPFALRESPRLQALLTATGTRCSTADAAKAAKRAAMFSLG